MLGCSAVVWLFRSLVIVDATRPTLSRVECQELGTNVMPVIHDENFKYTTFSTFHLSKGLFSKGDWARVFRNSAFVPIDSAVPALFFG